MSNIADKSVDMILCDLPYGTTACKWDSVIPFEPLWKQYERIIKDNGAIALTASQPFTTILISSNLKGFKYCWYWDKLNAGSFATAKYKPLSVFEDICVFSKNGGKTKYFPIMEVAEQKNKRPRDKHYERKEDNSNGMGSGIFKTSESHNEDLRYPKNRLVYDNRVGELNALNRLHPTQKPIALMEYLIKTYTNEGDTVLDNCMGSGTTGVACKKTGRHFIGIEKDEKYFKIAVSRVSTYFG
jgi:site-specific DNA-methyltransferase (adenine-specific)